LKIYLHGPRAGQDFKVKNIQFINGVAEVPKMLKTLERYYNVKDFPPGEEYVQNKDEFINNEHESIVDKASEESKDEDQSGTDILNQVVEAAKEKINKDIPNIKDWKKMPWWTAKAYVKEMTGKSPKNKETAIALMKEAGFE
jgi:hypothetical protein